MQNGALAEATEEELGCVVLPIGGIGSNRKGGYTSNLNSRYGRATNDNGRRTGDGGVEGKQLARIRPKTTLMTVAELRTIFANTGGARKQHAGVTLLHQKKLMRLLDEWMCRGGHECTASTSSQRSGVVLSSVQRARTTRAKIRQCDAVHYSNHARRYDLLEG